MTLNEIRRFKGLPKADKFRISELYPREIYKDFSADRLGQFLNEKAIRALLFIRHITDTPIIINDWQVGGPFNYSGYRPPDCKIGASQSAHKLNMAYDLKFPEIGAAEAWNILKKENLYFYGVRRVEDVSFTKTWLHFDVYEPPNQMPGELIVFKP